MTLKITFESEIPYSPKLGLSWCLAQHRILVDVKRQRTSTVIAHQFPART